MKVVTKSDKYQNMALLVASDKRFMVFAFPNYVHN